MLGSKTGRELFLWGNRDWYWRRCLARKWRHDRNSLAEKEKKASSCKGSGRKVCAQQRMCICRTWSQAQHPTLCEYCKLYYQLTLWSPCDDHSHRTTTFNQLIWNSSSRRLSSLPKPLWLTTLEDNWSNIQNKETLYTYMMNTLLLNLQSQTPRKEERLESRL